MCGLGAVSVDRQWYGFWNTDVAAASALQDTSTPIALSMPQSLVAVIAMALASLVSFQQHRSVLQQRMNAIRGNLAVSATAVATDKLDEIGSKAFDESTVAGPITSIMDLKPIVASEMLPAVLNDVSDFHGLWQTETRRTNDLESSFRVETSVSYVSEVDGATKVAYSSRLKMVTVTVVPEGLVRPDTIRVSEVLSCADRCRW